MLMTRNEIVVYIVLTDGAVIASVRSIVKNYVTHTYPQNFKRRMNLRKRFIVLIVYHELLLLAPPAGS